MRFIKVYLTVTLYILSQSGCVYSQGTNVSSDWHQATPEDVGLSSGLVSSLEKKAGTLNNIYSFVLIKNGSLISENYFNGANQSSVLHIRSITKSISSLLIGRAYNDGLIDSLSTPIITYYPNTERPEDGSNLEKISIQHVLDMQSGFSWNENEEVYNWYVTIPNPLEYILSKEVVNEPGSTWNYNSASVHLLSGVLSSSTMLSQEEYISNILFSPLGIQDYNWDRTPDNGIVRPDAGLALRPIDLAKIGQVFLKRGKYKSEQVIQEEWIMTSRDFKIDLNSSYGPLENLHYNNLWWMAEFNDHNIYFGLGYGGQLLIIVPDFEIVVVTNHDFMLPPEVVNSHSRAFLNEIFVPLLERLSEK